MGMILLQSLHSSIVSEYSRKPFFKKVEGSNLVFAQILTLKLSKMSVKGMGEKFDKFNDNK